MTNHARTAYGVVRNATELGRLVRAHRKDRSLNLETVSAIGGFSMRFLSEFERGKDTAELGKVMAALHSLGLEMVVEPRRMKPPPDDSEGSSNDATGTAVGRDEHRRP